MGARRARNAGARRDTRDGSSDISLGFTLVAALGALGSLPDLVRLVRGKLHAWRVDADAQGLRVTGYRAGTVVPWSQVKEVTTGIDGRLPCVVVKARNRDEIRVSVLAFDFTAEQLAARIESYR